MTVVRLSPGAAVDMGIEAAGRIGTSWLHLSLLRGPLHTIITQLYTQGNGVPAGRYDQTQAVELIVSQAKLNGYAEGLIRPHTEKIIGWLYAHGYHWAVDNGGLHVALER